MHGFAISSLVKLPTTRVAQDRKPSTGLQDPSRGSQLSDYGWPPSLKGRIGLRVVSVHPGSEAKACASNLYTAHETPALTTGLLMRDQVVVRGDKSRYRKYVIEG
jgi:hypothetical protein